MVALGGPRFSEADLWAVLPPSRREAAQDYYAQGRIGPCLRRGTSLAARLVGYGDHYYPHCDWTPEGWQVGCTCDRRMPCGHVAALWLIWARDPDRFQPFAPDPADPVFADAPWRWATGQPFPWDRVPATPPWYARPPADVGAALDAAARELARLRPRARHATLRTWARSAHPAWWEEPRWVDWLRTVLAREATRTSDPRELVAWVAVARDVPECPLDPLWASPAARHPAVEAAAWATLYQLAAEAALEPRPSARLRGRALLLALAALLDEPARAADLDRLFTAFGAFDPSGLLRADWLWRQGRTDEALRLARAGVHSARPAEADAWRQRLSRWTQAGDGAGPAPE
ncbi:MAG: hypothetical protein K6V97_11505 [Actinomycetia bacterium]|nr:hypothetical protein [Actinomycetes bacterium]